MKTILLLTFLAIGSLSFAQSKGDVDTRLYSKFSEKEISDLKENKPGELAYLNFYIANCYSIMELPSEKGNAHELKGSLSLKSLENVNIYDLNLTTKDKDYQYFKIEGTTKMLVILSNEQIQSAYQKSK